MHVQLRISGSDTALVRSHLFRHDGVEHGVVLACRTLQTARGLRLLVRDVFVARDGVDFTLGPSGFQFSALFVAKTSDWCRDHGCVWLSVHNHGDGNAVAFSRIDKSSHSRLYPTLLDLTGEPVGALVFASNAVAGRLLMPGLKMGDLDECVVVGERLEWLFPAPPPPPQAIGTAWNRQAMLLGPRGQELLRHTKVGVIGAGGGGALVLEQLAHLGLGEVVAIDPERIDTSNLSRIPGSTRADASAWLAELPFDAAKRLARRIARPKVAVAGRVASRANHGGRFRAIRGDVRDAEAIGELFDCDFIFCATDTMKSRLLFNILAYQFLIPGIQIGTKIPVSLQGHVGPIHVAVRFVTPDSGCLVCAGAISQRLLNAEALTELDQKAQRYVDDPDVQEPSVISLNSIAAAHATTDFLFYLTGLHDPGVDLAHQLFEPRSRTFGNVRFARDPDCNFCGRGEASRFAAGERAPLPVRASKRR
jgi:hypothetical protein